MTTLASKLGLVLALACLSGCPSAPVSPPGGPGHMDDLLKGLGSGAIHPDAAGQRVTVDCREPTSFVDFAAAIVLAWNRSKHGTDFELPSRSSLREVQIRTARSSAGVWTVVSLEYTGRTVLEPIEGLQFKGLMACSNHDPRHTTTTFEERETLSKPPNGCTGWKVIGMATTEAQSLVEASSLYGAVDPALFGPSPASAPRK